jgi:hypothetical protein
LLKSVALDEMGVFGLFHVIFFDFDENIQIFDEILQKPSKK